MNAATRVAATMTTENLKAAVKTFERELMAAMAAGRNDRGMQGQLEMLEAASAELRTRAKLVHPFE